MATYRTYSFKTLVMDADPDFFDPEVAYQFSNGREFKTTDRGLSGIYGETVITTEDGVWITTEDGDYLVVE